MMKQVIFVGTNNNDTRFTNPTHLVLGQRYTVLYEDEHGVELDGFRGTFDPQSFIPDVKVKFALGKYIPRVGESYSAVLIETTGEISTARIRTSTVQQVRPIGYKTYCTRTKNTIYIVKIE